MVIIDREMSNQYVQSLVFNIPERLRKALYLFQKDGVWRVSNAEEEF